MSPALKHRISNSEDGCIPIKEDIHIDVVGPILDTRLNHNFTDLTVRDHANADFTVLNNWIKVAAIVKRDYLDCYMYHSGQFVRIKVRHTIR